MSYIKITELKKWIELKYYYRHVSFIREITLKEETKTSIVYFTNMQSVLKQSHSRYW